MNDTASALRNAGRREIVNKLYADKKRDTLMRGKLEALRNPKALTLQTTMLTVTTRLLVMAAVGGVLWYFKPTRRLPLHGVMTLIPPEPRVLTQVTAMGLAVGAAFGAGGHTWPAPPTWTPNMRC